MFICQCRELQTKVSPREGFLFVLEKGKINKVLPEGNMENHHFVKQQNKVEVLRVTMHTELVPEGYLFIYAHNIYLWKSEKAHVIFF